MEHVNTCDFCDPSGEDDTIELTIDWMDKHGHQLTICYRCIVGILETMESMANTAAH